MLCISSGVSPLLRIRTSGSKAGCPGGSAGTLRASVLTSEVNTWLEVLLAPSLCGCTAPDDVCGCGCGCDCCGVDGEARSVGTLPADDENEVSGALVELCDEPGRGRSHGILNPCHGHCQPCKHTVDCACQQAFNHSPRTNQTQDVCQGLQAAKSPSDIGSMCQAHVHCASMLKRFLAPYAAPTEEASECHTHLLLRRRR